ncbi:hypothetical protein EAF00_002353 [Botryotinia globosa]|nr:hypothetical protein EAF00_002353 [Botryotinia globosa]
MWKKVEIFYLTPPVYEAVSNSLIYHRFVAATSKPPRLLSPALFSQPTDPPPASSKSDLVRVLVLDSSY